MLKMSYIFHFGISANIQYKSIADDIIDYTKQDGPKCGKNSDQVWFEHYQVWER